MSASPPQPPFDAKALGHRIAKKRQARGWSIDTLAGAAYLSRKTVINIEQGHKIARIDSLFAVAWALDLTLVELFSEDT